MNHIANQTNQLKHLDMLRFIAAAGIVFHHSREFFYAPDMRAAVRGDTSGLALFVDLFFVISGFIIAHVYSAKIVDLKSYGAFMQRRIGRLAPLHWLTMLISIILFGIAVSLGIHARHPPSFEPECLLKTALLVHGFLDCSGSIHNGISWSISVEMVMYIAFPAFLFLARRSLLFLIAIQIFALLFMMFKLSGSAATLQSIEGWENASPLGRATVSFNAGIVIWFCRDRIARLLVPDLFFFLLIGAMIVFFEFEKNVLINLVLIFGVVAAAVSRDFGYIKNSSRIGKWSDYLSYGGQFTYSIYMWHGLVILVFMNIIADKILRLQFWGMIGVACFTYLFLAVVSFVSFRLIETPARQWIDGMRIFR